MSYKIACARKQGSSHAKTNTPCQDEIYCISCGDYAAAALADGAGSAALSHYGARLCARTICELLSERFDEFYAANDGAAVKLEILGVLLAALKKLASSMQKRLADFASTLLCVAAKGDRFIIVHLGDGVIGYEKNGEMLVASHPENGEFSNTTVFVTSDDAARAMVLKRGRLGGCADGGVGGVQSSGDAGGIGGFVLMSDGPEACLYDKRQRRLSAGLARAISQAKYLQPECTQKLLMCSLEETISQHTSDDCALVIMAKSKLWQGPSTGAFCRLAGGNRRRARRLQAVYEQAADGASLRQIARRIYLPEKYAKRHIAQLEAARLLLQAGDKFYAVPAEQGGMLSTVR